MSFPGLPSRGLGGGGADSVGMSEQEQTIVKTVSNSISNKAIDREVIIPTADASSHGELSC